MKTLYAKLLSALFCLFLIGNAQGQTKKIDEYKGLTDSFNEFFNNIEWSDYEEEDLRGSFPCRGDGIPKLNRTRKPYRNAKQKDVVISLLPLIKLMSTVRDAVQGENFDKVKEAEGSFFDTPTFKQDKMIEKLQTANSAEQFVDFYGTKLDQSKVNFTKEEELELLLVYDKTKELLEDDRERATITEEYTIGDCKYTVLSRAWPIKIESNQVTWHFKTVVLLKCDCSPESSIYKLKRLGTEFIAEVTATWKNYDLKSMRFGKRKNLTMTVYGFDCCYPLFMDPVDEDDSGDPKPDDTKPDGTPKKDKDKDCCDETQDNNSIGFFPVLQFGNNFDDSTLGISVEYLRNMGNSFGNNEWYVGLQGTYATSSGQGGELTENFYSGTAIVENRTPILPCVNWVQRVSGEFGQGTLEAFGNTDDFTHRIIKLSTGATFDLTSNFSVAIDAALLEIGGQTFKPTNGPETKTDIANLFIPPQRVRFGFRFAF